jgi:hypothetical protein
VTFSLAFNLDQVVVIVMFSASGLFDGMVDLLFGKTILVVGDFDLFANAWNLFGSGNAKDAVLIDFEGDVDFSGSFGCGCESVKVEFCDKVVIGNKRSFSFKDG